MKTDRKKRAEEAVTAALRALRASSTENEMFEALAAGAWAARWLQAEQPDRAGWKCPPNGVPTCEALARWLMRDQSATSGQAVHEAERSITELIPDHSLMVIARRNEGEPEPDDEEEGIYVIRKSPENGPLVARFFYPLAHRAWTEAAEAAAGAGRKAPAHPIAVLVTAWQQQLPRPVRPETRPERILPSRLAMVQPAHRLADRGLFAVAAHRQPGADGQPVLPGFEIPEVEGPALPLALYDLGVGPNLHGGTRGAPLGLRFWIESVLSVPLDERLGDRPVAMEITLRELLARLYTSERRPRPNEYWPRLMAAVEALDSPDARIPWFDPITKRGGLRRVVTALGHSAGAECARRSGDSHRPSASRSAGWPDHAQDPGGMGCAGSGSVPGPHQPVVPVAPARAHAHSRPQARTTDLDTEQRSPAVRAAVRRRAHPAVLSVLGDKESAGNAAAFAPSP